MKIPLAKPYLSTEEFEAVRKVMNSGYIASGQTTTVFEDALARRFNRKHCILVNSGTSALYIALKVLAIEKVILPSVTCIQVLHAVLNAGSKPIFADIEAETHNIDPSSLSERQLDGADAIIVTHAYGHAADMDALEAFVKKYDLSLVEDFAQAAGGYFKNRILGSFGKFH